MMVMRGVVVLGVFLLATVSAGCERREGGAEQAGERVDEVVDNIQEGEPPFKEKGTAEKVGESIDDALNTGEGDEARDAGS